MSEENLWMDFCCRLVAPLKTSRDLMSTVQPVLPVLCICRERHSFTGYPLTHVLMVQNSLKPLIYVQWLRSDKWQRICDLNYWVWVNFLQNLKMMFPTPPPILICICEWQVSTLLTQTPGQDWLFIAGSTFLLWATARSLLTFLVKRSCVWCLFGCGAQSWAAPSSVSISRGMPLPTYCSLIGRLSKTSLRKDPTSIRSTPGEK